MNAAILAAGLSGIEYPVRISKETLKAAKDAGLVIVYGASDDLMELEGAITDEFGCYGGGTALIDHKGIIPNWEESNDSEGDAKEYFRRKGNGAAIKAMWCTETDYSWTYKTNIPHETFEVVEDGYPYCRGIVFSVANLNADHIGKVLEK